MILNAHINYKKLLLLCFLVNVFIVVYAQSDRDRVARYNQSLSTVLRKETRNNIIFKQLSTHFTRGNADTLKCIDGRKTLQFIIDLTGKQTRKLTINWSGSPISIASKYDYFFPAGIEDRGESTEVYSFNLQQKHYLGLVIKVNSSLKSLVLIQTSTPQWSVCTFWATEITIKECINDFDNDGILNLLFLDPVKCQDIIGYKAKMFVLNKNKCQYLKSRFDNLVLDEVVNSKNKFTNFMFITRRKFQRKEAQKCK